MTTIMVSTDFTTSAPAGTAAALSSSTFTWILAGVERFSVNGIGALSAVGSVDVFVRVDGSVYGDSVGMALNAAPGGSNNQVFVGETGMIIGGNGTGLSVQSIVTKVVNQGLISGASIGISSGASGFSLTNEGMVQGSVVLVGANAVILNTGQINGRITLSGAVVTARIENSGTIGRDAIAVEGQAGNDEVINRGILNGTVNLGGGFDKFDGSGGASTAFWGVNGGAGGDNIRGSDFADVLSGDADEDILTGQGGDDTVNGGSQSDTIRGGGGEDALLGGTENDRLFGGGDDDNMIGGTGADRMTGGSGADRFVFANAAEIGLTAGLRDRIEDFTSGQDKIDLANIAGLSFIGATAFGSVAGQVRYAKGLGEVQIDLNGDAKADAVLDLGRGTVLVEFDVLLV